MSEVIEDLKAANSGVMTSYLGQLLGLTSVLVERLAAVEGVSPLDYLASLWEERDRNG